MCSHPQGEEMFDNIGEEVNMGKLGGHNMLESPCLQVNCRSSPNATPCSFV